MTTAPGIRARNRAAIESAILDVARTHLATVGAAGLSLRAVARDLHMTSSAVYRYVASRDELLTRLIVASYDSLADAVDAAVPPATAGARARARAKVVSDVVTVGQAMRSWALAHPHEWSLVYGSPVPGYDAPATTTNAAGTRVTSRLLALRVEAGPSARRGHPRRAIAAARELIAADAVLTASGISPGALLEGIDAWSSLVALVSRELFAQLGPLPDPEAIFDDAVRRLADDLIP